MFRLITLDVHNTLLRVRGSVGQLYSKTALNYGYRLDAKILESEFRKTYKVYCDKYPNFGVQDNMSTQDWWRKIVSKTFKNTGCKDDQVVQDMAGSLYREFTLASNWELFPEVKSVLKRLKNRGYCLGIVSNFDERLPQILNGLDILSYFSFVLCSTEVKVAKPSPEIFQLALEQGGVSSKEALHVGDNINLDYRASIAVGMSAYLVDRHKDLKLNDIGINPDHILSDLNLLLNL
jgi:REG-2-like HAD superfamily hydrolase